MRWRCSRRRFASGALGGLIVVAALVAVGCQGKPAVPTLRLEPRAWEQKVTAEGWLAAEQVTPVTVPPEVRSAVRLAWLAPEASQVARDEVVARFDAGDLQANLLTATSAFDGAGFRIAQTAATSDAERAGMQGALEKANLELALAEKFQKVDVGVWSRHEIIESQIDGDLARDRAQHAARKQATQARRAKSDLDLLKIEQGQASRKIGEAQAGLAALEVKAPHAGIFLRSRDWRGEPLEVGAQMWRGRPVGEIPDLGKMQARVFALEADAGGIAAGQRVDVVVESRPGAVLVGKVARVDSVAKPREQGSPVQYFEVTVALEGDQTAATTPGQRVRATIYLASEKSALVVPRQAVAMEGEGHRVWVRSGDGFAPREVKLGAGDRGLVVIASGLESGDEIALRPPDAAARDNGAQEKSAAAGSPAPGSSNPGSGET